MYFKKSIKVVGKVESQENDRTRKEKRRKKNEQIKF